jgi:hypothetical protein
LQLGRWNQVVDWSRHFTLPPMGLFTRDQTRFL